MTKIYELFEAYAAVSNTCELIKICEATMSDSSNLLKKEPDSQELKAIYDRAYSDCQLLRKIHEEFKDYYDELYEKYSRDSEFIKEVMNAQDVSEECSLFFAGLKADICNKNGIEKGC